MVNNTTSLLSDPKVLQLFLYSRKAEGEVSIRQVQRDLGLASSSIHWQLGKLVDAGLMEKGMDSQYQLSQKGKAVNSVSLHVATPYILLGGKLLPTTLFHLAFLLSSLVIAAVILLFNPLTALILLFLVLIVEVSLQFQQYRGLQVESLSSKQGT